MKKLFLLTVVSFLVTGAFAQSEKYVANMKNNITAIDSSFKNPQNLLSSLQVTVLTIKAIAYF